MIVYRLSKCIYINDLSGLGSAQFPGRWNSKGSQILYTAQSASLAVLESVAHISGLKVSAPYCLISLEIPESSIKEILIDELPPDWKQFPPPDHLKKIGDQFNKENEFLVLKVPSAIVPEDHNYLINPLHKDFEKVKVVKQRPFEFDQRII